MRTAGAILVCVFLNGCSSRHEPSQGDSPKIFTFVDGAVMQVRKRDGICLEGIHLVQKLNDGSKKCDAEKGKMIEDANSQIVHVILYDAQVEMPSGQRMIVGELKMDLVKEIVLHKGK